MVVKKADQLVAWSEFHWVELTADLLAEMTAVETVAPKVGLMVELSVVMMGHSLAAKLADLKVDY